MLKNNLWLLLITHEKTRFYYVFTTAPMLRGKKYESKFSKCPITECSTKLLQWLNNIDDLSASGICNICCDPTCDTIFMCLE